MKNYFLIIICMSILSFGQKKPIDKQNCILDKYAKIVTSKKKKMDIKAKNVFGTDLEIASLSPLTGFYRDGYCSTGSNDSGIHVVAAVMTNEFLQYSKKQGNDLVTPNLQYGFPGLKPGDVWCLCAKRWKEAFDASVAPPVLLNATNKRALDYISMENLTSKALR